MNIFCPQFYGLRGRRSFSVVAACFWALFSLAGLVYGQETAGLSLGEENPKSFPINPRYKLIAKDQITVSVFDEPDLSITQRIDEEGFVIIPLLGKVKLAGMHVRDAELHIRKQFIAEEYLLDPQVTVTVLQYADKRIYVFGEVRSPGTKMFPLEAKSLDIVEVISMAGDFTEYAKANAVRITRKDKNGREDVLTVDVEKLITGSRSGRGENKSFAVLPGDVVYIPERRF